ncbi:MAG: DEAD/DEAH box helicase [Candidatus Bathyarchaeia archaeon]|nr:DEAD/DEAH box helicase [Candidatus Bathyarchaeia archaeon]
MKITDLPVPESVKEIIIRSGIGELYPPQEEAIKAGALEGRNLVLASPTASGKTLVAEFCALKHVLEKNGKTIYLTPLRALASEKFEEFKKYASIRKANGKRVRIGISTGDYDSTDPWLERYDIIVSTNEKADSLLRHRAKWMDEISLIVADEVHLLNDAERGPTLEVVLARLMQINPDMQILALSATINNVEEIAEWLKAGYVTTEWRPILLKEGVLLHEEIQYKDGDARKVEKKAKNSALNMALSTVKTGGQALIFATTRRNAVTLAKKTAPEVEGLLSKPVKRALEHDANKILATGERTRISELLAELVKHGTAFHHAGLGGGHRRIIEDSFRQGKIKVLTATPTLAFGVNLPARTVVIQDYRRYEPGYGYYPISVLEYKQMCLPFETRIILKDGSITSIGEIVENRSDVPVLSYEPSSSELRQSTVLKHFRNKTTVLTRVTTNIGASIQLTPEHPLLVKRGKHTMWVPACEINRGDKVGYVKYDLESKFDAPYTYKFLPPNITYVQGKLDIFELAKVLDTRQQLSEKLGVKLKTLKGYIGGKKAVPLWIILQLASWLNLKDGDVAKRIGKVKTAYGTPLNLPKKLNEDFMWLVGIVASDGNLKLCKDKNGSVFYLVRIQNNASAIIKKIVRISKNFGVKPKVMEIRKGTFYVEIRSSLLALILSKFGIPFGRKSYTLSVHDFMMELPKNLIGAYLAGVFDGDGSYSETKIKRGINTKVRAVVFSTASKYFAIGLHNLLLRLGVLSKIEQEPRKNYRKLIRGKLVKFKGPFFRVSIKRILDINTFAKFVKPTKYVIPHLAYSKYHNLDKYYEKKRAGSVEWIKVANVTTERLKEPITVYNLSINDTEIYIASNFIVHNCGRAGRPRYDKMGESVLIARTADEADYLMESYILAHPERIWSRLAVERILRSHVLATIAADFAHTERGIYDFFGRTFYAYQYEIRAIRGIIAKILKYLYDEEMIDLSGENIYATKFGKRVSELYIDPVSGVLIRNALRRKPAYLTDLSLIHMIAHTPDMAPKLRPYTRELDEISVFMEDHKEEFLLDFPDEWEDRIAYEEFLGEVKTAMVLKTWIKEMSEDEIIERFRVQPGDLYRTIQNAKWLLYATHELALLFGNKQVLPQTLELMERIEKGVKKELLPIVKLEGVGRVRGRILYNAGFKTIEDIKHAAIEDLVNLPLIGPRLAKKIKEQVGGFVRKEEWKRLEKGEAWEQKALTEY